MRTALFLFIAAGLFGQDFAGEWQGTLKMGTASQRIVLRIEKSPGGWNARSYSVDQSVEAIKATAVSAEGQAIKIALDSIQAKYDGTLSADGKTIKGSLKQVGMTMPLDFERATPGASWYKHDSPHKARFVDVDTNVKLEVLDWGGTGRPLIFLSGLGNSAHIFDDFAPKFVGTHHVYGITRRGYGESSVPTSGYSADRMGDDILAVIEALKIEKPVLAGHSIAGEELSSIGSRFPAKVAGLIYLDAGFPYAFYDKDRGELQMDLPEILQKFQKLLVGKNGGDERKVVKELIAQMPMLEKLLAERETIRMKVEAMLDAVAALDPEMAEEFR